MDTEQIKKQGEQGTDNVQAREDKGQLKLLLVQKADQKIDDKFADKSFDRYNEIVELLSGATINLKEEEEKLRATVAQAMKEYSPRVPKEFYREINRLNGWTKPDDQLFRKPPIVGRYTNEIIYSRYNRNVLPALQHLNPYVRIGIRKFKHFQWLSEGGQTAFDIYIQDAIEVMKECKTWYEFRVKHAKKFGVNFQLNFFNENNSNQN